MATDSTELTFVRCPACRSLVPAVSTRCRMCGATLDASLGSESSQPPASGRVRQKTMTTSAPGELADQVDRLRDEMSGDDTSSEAPAEVMEAQSGSTPVSTSPSSDPLSGYLDEEESDEISPLEDQDEDDFDEPMEDMPFEEDEDLQDDIVDEEDMSSEIEEVQVQPEPQEVAPVASVTESLDKAKEVLTQMGAPEPKKSETKTRVVVDQGKGRGPKPGLSFGSRGSETPQRRFDIPKEDKIEKPIEAMAQEVAPVEPKPIEAKPIEQKPVEAKREERPRIEPAPVQERSTPSPIPQRDVVKKGDALGKLFGWMVNYNEPNGVSIELREGRFFVSASQLRSTDLVLDDSTISTPHAMFTIGLDTGILIQDLKSERGVFIRERDASTYRREYDSAQLNHGDWIRFGDLEFLVSLIAHVGVK